MSFIIYDLTFLVLFCIFIVVFLYRNKKNLGREGIIFLYRTQLGVKLINYVGKNFKKTLSSLRYVIIAVSYLLMLGILYILIDGLYKYVMFPQITEAIKAPPLAPVIPYFPKLFAMESFFPPFYFTYFILAIAIVALVHEFSHGIYMKYSKVKIKSTGLAFLGPILGAFVEQDEKSMEKASKTNQMAILGAGVFANLIFAFIFFLFWWLIFSFAFVPAGVTFNSYPLASVNVSSLDKIDGIPITDYHEGEILELIEKNNITNNFVSTQGEEINLTEIKADNQTYFIQINNLKKQLKKQADYVILFEDYPAIKAGLKGTIIEVQENEINTYKDLENTIKELSPGQEIELKTKFNEKILEYNLTLDENPKTEGAFFGIVNSPQQSLKFEDQVAFFKNPHVDYETKNEFFGFVYYLFFWIFLLNFLVALFNMLPFAILDGGRFFYLTVLGITKNEKIARFSYKWIGMLILFIFLLMMFVWIVRVV